jgi:hypothetical protein
MCFEYIQNKNPGIRYLHPSVTQDFDGNEWPGPSLEDAVVSTRSGKPDGCESRKFRHQSAKLLRFRELPSSAWLSGHRREAAPVLSWR